MTYTNSLETDPQKKGIVVKKIKKVSQKLRFSIRKNNELALDFLF